MKKVITKIEENADKNTERIRKNKSRIDIKITEEILKEIRSNNNIHCNFKIEKLKAGDYVTFAYNFENEIIVN